MIYGNSIPTVEKTSIEASRFGEFMSDWGNRHNNDKKHLRLGQAFHQFFGLEKSTQFKNEYDKLYQLDGDKAKQKIQDLFDFN